VFSPLPKPGELVPKLDELLVPVPRTPPEGVIVPTEVPGNKLDELTVALETGTEPTPEGVLGGIIAEVDAGVLAPTLLSELPVEFEICAGGPVGEAGPVVGIATAEVTEGTGCVTEEGTTPKPIAPWFGTESGTPCWACLFSVAFRSIRRTLLGSTEERSQIQPARISQRIENGTKRFIQILS